jgi:hypothetical protein
MSIQNPRLAAARQAITLLRRYRATGSSVVLDFRTGERLLVLASKILTGRCDLTGENPETVMDALEADLGFRPAT